MAISKVNRPKDSPGFEIGGPELLNVRETAKALRVSERSVYRLIKKKAVKATTIGGRHFVFRDALVAQVNESGIPL